MTTLLERFASVREALRAELERAPGLAEATDAIQCRLDDLTRAHLEDLDVPSARRASDLLNLWRQNLEVLKTLKPAAGAHPAAYATSHAAPAAGRAGTAGPGWIEWGQIGLMAALVILMLMVTGASWLGWVGLILGIALLVLKLAAMIASRMAGPAPVRITQTSLPAAARPDPAAITAHIEQTLGLLDFTLDSLRQADVDRRRDTAAKAWDPGLENYRSVCEFFQRIWMQTRLRNVDILLEWTKTLPVLLAEQGLRLVTYQGAEPREWFEFEPSILPGLTAPETLLPALVKGDRVILQGRVAEPA